MYMHMLARTHTHVVRDIVTERERERHTHTITHIHIISYHIISYHITSHHIISYHIISYHIISYHIISYHIISYHIISHTHTYIYICIYIYVYTISMLGFGIQFSHGLRVTAMVAELAQSCLLAKPRRFTMTWWGRRCQIRHEIRAMQWNPMSPMTSGILQVGTLSTYFYIVDIFPA